MDAEGEFGFGDGLEYLEQLSIVGQGIGRHRGGHIDFKSDHPFIRLLLDVVEIAFPHILAGHPTPQPEIHIPLGADGFKFVLHARQVAYRGDAAARHVDDRGDTACGSRPCAGGEGLAMGEPRVHEVHV